MNHFSKNNQLKISKPCPMNLNSMDKKNGNFYCKSCSKAIIDYRGMKWEDFISSYKNGECGIFDQKELVENIKWVWYKKIIFNFLGLISIIGFSVKPVFAHNNSGNIKDSVLVDNKPAPLECINENQFIPELADLPKKPNKKKSFFRKQKKTKPKKLLVLGCPDF